MTGSRGWWQWAYCALALAFIFAPIVVVVVFSFDRLGIGTFPMTGFTLHWYQALFNDSAFTDAAQNSLYVAAVATTLALTLGTLAAFALTWYPVRFSGAFYALVLLPVALPGLLVGVALLSFFTYLGVELSLNTVIAAHTLLLLPFVVLTVAARLSSFDRSLQDASADLGASPIQTYRRVTFPLMRTTLIGAGLLAVAISLDEFLVTFFTIGSQNTLPVVIWGEMRLGVSPVVNAVSTTLLLVTFVLVMATWILSRRAPS